MAELASLTARQLFTEAAAQRVVACCDAAAMKAADTAYRVEILQRGAVQSTLLVLEQYEWSTVATVSVMGLLKAMCPEPLGAGALL